MEMIDIYNDLVLFFEDIAKFLLCASSVIRVAQKLWDLFSQMEPESNPKLEEN